MKEKGKLRNSKSKVESLYCGIVLNFYLDAPFIDFSDFVKWYFDIFRNRNMYCPGCGCRYDSHEQIYCDRCLSARDVNDFLRLCFDRGYPYDAIIGLLAGKGVQMSIRTLKRRLKALGLKRKANQFGDDYLRHVIQEEMQDAGSLAGYRSIWHALRLRRGIHVSSHDVSRLMKEIDPLGVEERKKRRLHRRTYRSEGPNACWHLDGNLYAFNS